MMELCDKAVQGRRKVWKSEGATRKVVSIICPLVEICQNLGGPWYPSTPGSDSSSLGVLRNFLSSLIKCQKDNKLFKPKTFTFVWQSACANRFRLFHPITEQLNARTYLQLPLRQWGASNVYLLVLSSWKLNIAENTHCRNGVVD